jgi:diaminopropionate ammonia-lyase
MAIVENRWRLESKVFPVDAGVPLPSTNAAAVSELLAKCPAARETPLLAAPALAGRTSSNCVFLKDERGRMGLGSFKALGAAYVIAREAANAAGGGDPVGVLKDRSFVTASAGNHGLSVAAGCKVFGARAVIYLSETVPAGFARKLAAKGAEVRREGADYEASMAAAARAAEQEGMTLLSDSSWDGYTELPHRLMEGYLAMAAETCGQLDEAPTHIFLQAGVGGMAAAVAALFRKEWGEAPTIVVVEPEAAPALKGSIEAGRFATASGPVSNMGRLDCKEPSLIALRGLARDADFFATVSDTSAAQAAAVLGPEGVDTTPSGAAGVAALLDETIRSAAGCGPQSRLLAIISEEA